MATIKLSNTKKASRSINYAEKRAVVKSGYNCDVDYAKSSFKAVRALYGKETGIQAHLVIQSFKPGEVTPEKANKIGLELAEKIAPNHQVTVYTHDDTEHIHNHIVINSVDIETGKKYQSNRKQMNLVKEMSNKLCLENNLSVINFDKKSDVTYTLPEKALIEKNKTSWKEEIRQVVDYAKENSSNRQEFVEHLNNFGIEFKETAKNVSYLHPDHKKFVRGKKLGNLYDKEALKDVFERQIKRSEERGIDWDQFESKVRKAEFRETERTDSDKTASDRERPQKQYRGAEKDAEYAQKRIQQVRRESDGLEQ